MVVAILNDSSNLPLRVSFVIYPFGQPASAIAPQPIYEQDISCAVVHPIYLRQ
ncbi:MAG: hypothetical protein KME30_07960 [Iphinoe sp. HA4291-MV1]|nr:hypothetical protein [Iphinoe sp. HA4291-MV1]